VGHKGARLKGGALKKRRPQQQIPLCVAGGPNDTDRKENAGHFVRNDSLVWERKKKRGVLHFVQDDVVRFFLLRRKGGKRQEPRSRRDAGATSNGASVRAEGLKTATADSSLRGRRSERRGPQGKNPATTFAMTRFGVGAEEEKRGPSLRSGSRGSFFSVEEKRQEAAGTAEPAGRRRY
jgi:hypothetical protein